MTKPSPCPLPKIETTVHGGARTAIVRTAASAVCYCETFESAEEQAEYFTILRDWAALNLAALDALRSGLAAGVVRPTAAVAGV